MLCFEISKIKLKAHALPKEDDNMAVLLKDCRRDQQRSGAPGVFQCMKGLLCMKSISSPVPVAQDNCGVNNLFPSPRCLAFLHFVSRYHPPWTWLLSWQTLENDWLACYLPFITLNVCLTLTRVDCVILHLWLYTLGFGERREELIWLCHGGEMSALAGGVAWIELAAPYGRQIHWMGSYLLPRVGYHLQLCKARAQAPDVMLYLALFWRSVHYCIQCKWEHLA